MDKQLRALAVFHLTGRHADDEPRAVEVGGLRPALMAAYRNLASLRHDFPVIFTGSGDEYVQSLTATVDAALRAVAPPGVAGEGQRRRALKVEREICRRVAAGERGTVAELWDRAVQAVAPPGDAAFVKDVAQVRLQLAAEGEVAGCDAALPARYLRHAFSAVQKEKARAARERIDGLATRLGDILRADYARSEAALTQPALQASFGAAHRGMFDFGAMSRLLLLNPPRGGLGERRKRRVEESLAVLRAQRFFARAGEAAAAGAHQFEFDNAEQALAAFRERLPELARLLKALQAAELEVSGSYVEDLHDAIFAAYDEHSVTAQDLQFFPDYLVCLEPCATGERGTLADALSSGIPLKVLVHIDDLLEEAMLGHGRFAFGLRATQLASAAMSYDDVFVVQSAASNLFQLREHVQRGLRHAGPALFSVFAAPDGGAVPGYLQAAAAMQSRAFPAFTYDPYAGADLASRLSLDTNPQPERDWPLERLHYADPDLQAVSEDLAFTFADFAVCEARCARHFEPAPRAAWGEGMITAQQWLANPEHDAAAGVPYVLAVDEADLLCRLVVDERLMLATLRCREAWHRLQELGGIHDSRTERLLARERAAWQEEQRLEAATVAALTVASTGQPAPTSTPTAAVVLPPVPEAEPARNPDEPHIETVRCSSCNECTQINPRMFAYNENKQAYIVDLKAGSYKQMVEAAESCQVSIIHPGKPWDPTEPGLDELRERAQPFV